MAVSRERAVVIDGGLVPPTGLSPTSASTWQQCQLRYALTYQRGWSEGATVPQLIGNTTHLAIEWLYGLPHADRTRPRASELLVAAYDEEAAKPGVANLVANIATLRQQVLEVGEDALDGLFELERPELVNVGPDGLEVWVRATLYGAPVRGRIDRLYDASGAYVVADYKTGKTAKPAYARKAFFGLLTYAAALAASDDDKILPDRVELLYLIGRDRLTRPVLREVALGHARELATIWQEVQAATGAGRVTARTSALCSWCAFETVCPARVRTPLPAVGGAEHDALLLDAGLTRRDQVTVATSLERVTSRAEEAGADEEEP